MIKLVRVVALQATLTLAKKRAGCINRLILHLIGSHPTRSHDLAAGVKEDGTSAYLHRG